MFVLPPKTWLELKINTKVNQSLQSGACTRDINNDSYFHAISTVPHKEARLFGLMYLHTFIRGSRVQQA